MSGDCLRSHASSTRWTDTPRRLATVSAASGGVPMARRTPCTQGRRCPVRRRPGPWQVIGAAVRELVLDGGDRSDGERLVQLVGGHVGQPDGRDLPFAAEVFQRAHAVRQGHLCVNVVELVKVDPVHAERPQAGLAVPQLLRRPSTGKRSPSRQWPPLVATSGRSRMTSRIARAMTCSAYDSMPGRV